MFFSLKSLSLRRAHDCFGSAIELASGSAALALRVIATLNLFQGKQSLSGICIFKSIYIELISGFSIGKG